MSGSGLFTNKKPQTPHLVAPGPGVAGEVADLRSDVASALAPLATVTVEEFTNPVVADTDGIKTAIATVAAITTYSGAALNGAVGAGVMSPPRNPTVTASDSAGSYVGSVTFTGVDINGNAITEAVAISNNATAVGAKAFAKITSIGLVAQTDTAGSLQFGFGAKMGLAKKIKSRAGLATAIKEIAVGAVVTNGTFVAAATGLPNGTYAPNTPQNSTNDYAIYYEYDPLA